MNEKRAIEGVPPTLIQIVVTFNPSDGEINVNGPLHDKIFCLGILDIAKEIVRNFKGGAPQILRPTFVPPRDLG